MGKNLDIIGSSLSGGFSWLVTQFSTLLYVHDDELVMCLCDLVFVLISDLLKSIPERYHGALH